MVPLHVHSQYSLLDATASVEAIAEKAAAHKSEAIALTDHGNLYGVVEFYKACQAVHVKPIIGCEFYVAPTSRLEKKKEGSGVYGTHLVLLAKNQTGYRNLCALSSLGFLEGFYYFPRIDRELLVRHKEGLICLSGCTQGSIAHALLTQSVEACREEILWHKALFEEDFYLELQRHPMSEAALQEDGFYQESWLLHQYKDFISKQERVNKALLELGHELKIACVATNNSHYIERNGWKAHQLLMNVQSGEPCYLYQPDAQGKIERHGLNPKRRTRPSNEFYLKSPEQMAELFKDCPEAITTTVEIAHKCSVTLDFKTRHYPVFVPPEMEGTSFTPQEQAKAAEAYLWNLCQRGISQRYTPERLEQVRKVYPDRDPLEVVKERLAYEMSVIVPKGMSDYLLIVWDFIHWAKNNKVPMGPGRGSGAGSIVLYLIGITDIEPLRFHLFFERFINPERLSYPDIDVDMCMERRQDVIDYVLGKYGKEKVAQIITFGAMKARMAIKDVARAIGVPLNKVNQIAKLVPEDLQITIESALEKDQDLRALYEGDPEVKELLERATELEGCVRNSGIHAAGIIISAVPLIEHIPICVAKDSIMPVTQLSMKPVEMVGMLKMDFLGLKTLTAIQMAIEEVQRHYGIVLDWVNLPLDDKETFALLNQGKTLGVFQLESEGMRDLARNLHLDRFEEIIAVGALYRPGPMDMIPSFIARKHGQEAIESDHPWMAEILAETYGIMVYQEQVMQIASRLANYSLGEGDVLRRAMGKKDAEQMAKERDKFRKGALVNNIDEETSMRIFDKIEKFASYGFNKSHAAAYGFLSYVTAYLKAHYPKEWLAALMSCDSHDITKVAKFVREAHTMQIALLPPDINEAQKSFGASAAGIRFGLSAIKGVGEGVVEAVLEERLKKGPFVSLYNFVHRVDRKRVQKKAIELLVDAGSFDYTGWSRDALKASVEPMYQQLSALSKEEEKGYMRLFDSHDAEETFLSPPVVAERTQEELLLREKELLGLFLMGHPLDAQRPLLERLGIISLAEARALKQDAVARVAFCVETIAVRFSSKTQKKYALVTVSDAEESAEFPIWAELYEQVQPFLQENQLFLAVVQVDAQQEPAALVPRWIGPLANIDEEQVVAMERACEKAKQRPLARPKPVGTGVPPAAIYQLSLPMDKLRSSHLLRLRDLLEAHPGKTVVHIKFHVRDSHYATLALHRPVTISDRLLQDVQKIIQG